LNPTVSLNGHETSHQDPLKCEKNDIKSQDAHKKKGEVISQDHSAGKYEMMDAVVETVGPALTVSGRKVSLAAGAFYQRYNPYGTMGFSNRVKSCLWIDERQRQTCSAVDTEVVADAIFTKSFRNCSNHFLASLNLVHSIAGNAGKSARIFSRRGSRVYDTSTHKVCQNDCEVLCTVHRAKFEIVR
jgi:hypothetical protein